MDTSEQFDSELAFLLYLYNKELTAVYNGDDMIAGEIGILRIEYMRMFGFKRYMD